MENVGSPVERPKHTFADCNSDVIFHLCCPGTKIDKNNALFSSVGGCKLLWFVPGVEKIVVTSMKHHPWGLSHQPLLQQIVEVTLEDLHWRSQEVDSTWMKFSDEDNGGLQGQRFVLLPQEVVSTRLRILEVMRIYGPSNTLRCRHQWSPNIQVRTEWIVRCSHRGATNRLSVHGPRGVVNNVSVNSPNIFLSIMLNIFPPYLPLTLCNSGAHILSWAHIGQVSLVNTHDL